jgi:hypothetical protein
MKYILLIHFLSLLISWGCKPDRPKVPVSNINIEVEIQRFERDLFSMNIDSIEQAIPGFEKKYGRFFTLFGYVINIGEPSDPSYSRFLQAFLTDRVNNDVYIKCMEIFSDIKSLKYELSQAFKHYKYYFPEKQIPHIYTFISGFNSSIVIDTNILAIGLDRYLGRDYKYYSQLGIPHYQRDKMYKEKIPTDCMYAWARTEFDAKVEAYNVLNNILNEGKLIYFVQAMIPGSADELIMGFNSEQLKWCKNNENEMWTYLIENELLYNTNHLSIRKLTGEAPYTSFFPKESPGRAAVWLGWKVIEQYMNQNPEVTLAELMIDSDYQKILQASGYDPR